MGSLIKKTLIAAAAFSLPCLALSETLTYTENTNSSTEAALGYPVPLPKDSLVAIDGFRTYSSLKMHHDAMALQHAEMTPVVVGQTRNNRDITAFVFGDADNLDSEGKVEPAFLINGTIHAREWQSPEVVTELMERLIEEKSDQGMVQYLLENTNIVILPVLNIDGFLQTQRYPNQVTNSPGTTASSSRLDKFAQPRDGRMRRKNMPNVDEDISTNSDRLLGIDLNRNSKHFFGVQQGNNDPNSLIYGGPSIFSEPETQALLEAAKLGPENKLRFYQDTHSFSRVLFVPQPNNSRRNAITNSIAGKFQATTTALGANYFPVIDQVGSGIPTTADYFAYEHQVPSWTLEIEPPQGFQGEPDGGAFYGGTGLSHSGFIAPDSAIARIRDQLAPAQMLMFYHQAGPAHVKSVRIADSSDNTVYAADWQTNSNGRSLNITVDNVLQGGQQYKLWISFSKPMRIRNANGNIVQYTGQSVSLTPAIALSGQSASGTFNRSITTANSNWQNQSGGELSGYDTYKDDAILLNFTVPSNINVSSSTGNTNFNLNINVQDLAGLSLDANPSTVVDWTNGAWSNYENASNQLGDVGGTDASYSLKVSNATLTLNATNSASGGGGGVFSVLILILMLFLCVQKLVINNVCIKRKI
ncbi:MAG: hypothetical protein HWD86_08995 [Kangiellaceae bacterium]|nr:hypothetical protein [Kangiellaceae bacterium]